MDDYVCFCCCLITVTDWSESIISLNLVVDAVWKCEFELIFSFISFHFIFSLVFILFYLFILYMYISHKKLLLENFASTKLWFVHIVITQNFFACELPNEFSISARKFLLSQLIATILDPFPACQKYIYDIRVNFLVILHACSIYGVLLSALSVPSIYVINH